MKKEINCVFKYKDIKDIDRFDIANYKRNTVITGTNIVYMEMLKVASTSILYELLVKHQEMTGNNKEVELDSGLVHQNARQELVNLSLKELSISRDNWWIFSFVRNPWDRVVGYYTHQHSHISFYDFVMLLAERDFKDIDRHLIPQRRILYYKGVLIPHFVGKLENFEEDWKFINNMFPTSIGKMNIPMMNISSVVDFRTFYKSDKLIELVGNKYSEDIKAFGYTFED